MVDGAGSWDPPPSWAESGSAYGIEVDPTSHDIIHSAALYIVDRRGDERSGYVAPFLPKLVTADVRALERSDA